MMPQIFSSYEDVKQFGQEMFNNQINIEELLIKLVNNTSYSYLKRLTKQYKVINIISAVYSVDKLKDEEGNKYNYRVDYIGLDEDENTKTYYWFFN